MRAAPEQGFSLIIAGPPHEVRTLLGLFIGARSLGLRLAI